jgi:hypothetical protein
MKKMKKVLDFLLHLLGPYAEYMPGCPYCEAHQAALGAKSKTLRPLGAEPRR